MNTLQRLETWRKQNKQHPPLWLITTIGLNGLSCIYLFAELLGRALILPIKDPTHYDILYQKTPPSAMMISFFLIGVITWIIFTTGLRCGDIMKDYLKRRKEGQLNRTTPTATLPKNNPNQ